MPSKQILSASDIRLDQDFKRERDQTRKYQHGKALGPGRQDPAHARPARPDTRESPGVRRDGVRVATFKHRKTVGHQAEINQHFEESGDSSAPEDIEEASAAPVPDAEIAYSYDAEHGPTHDSQIFKAVVELGLKLKDDKETAKTLKNEYIVLDMDGEPVAGKKSKKVKSPKLPPTELIDRDDFVMV